MQFNLILVSLLLLQTVALDCPDDVLIIQDLEQNLKDLYGIIIPAWNSSVGFCNYGGITCNGGGCVTEINLSNTGVSLAVSMVVFEPIYNLPKLKSLTLSGNPLFGDLSHLWGNFQSIEYISINTTNIKSILPKEWGKLSKLVHLDLCVNYLYGVIPVEWSGLTSLQYLDLDSNNLEGYLLDSFSQLYQLQTLYLYLNKFIGGIPESWSNMTNMVNFDLDSNNLTGNLSASFSSMVNITIFDVSYNNITGIIPPEWNAWNSIVILRLQFNQLFGSIPEFSLPMLGTILLNNNMLSGPLPSFPNMILTSIDLSFNNLVGFLNSAWAALPLTYINLSSNLLFGPFPVEWFFIKTLTHLLLQDNNFQGPLFALNNNCSSTCSLEALSYVDFSGNQFNGPFESSHFLLPNMTYLDIAENKLSRAIDINFPNIKLLNLSSNAFNLMIKEESINLPPNSVLDLRGNEFICPYPSIPEITMLTESCFLDWIDSGYIYSGGFIFFVTVFAFAYIRNKLMDASPWNFGSSSIVSLRFLIFWFVKFVDAVIDFIIYPQMYSVTNQKLVKNNCITVNEKNIFSLYIPVFGGVDLNGDYFNPFPPENSYTTFNDLQNELYITGYGSLNKGINKTFEAICFSVGSGCYVNNGVCLEDENSKIYLKFFLFLLSVSVTIILLKELGRLVVILYTSYTGYVPRKLRNLCMNSVFAPLLAINDRRMFFEKIVFHTSTHYDILMEMLYDGVLEELNQLAMTLYFIFQVAATGPSIELMLTIPINTVGLLGKAGRAYYSYHYVKVVKTPHASRGSKNSNLSRNKVEKSIPLNNISPVGNLNPLHSHGAKFDAFDSRKKSESGSQSAKSMRNRNKSLTKSQDVEKGIERETF